MKEWFRDVNFRDNSLSVIGLVNGILAEYAAAGYDLSLRQLYYQLVARGHIPNNDREYKRLGNIVSDARLAGLIDWEMIEDRGRHTQYASHWESPAQIARAAAEQFQIDKWANQPCHVEVMVEKQALEGVLIPVCRELDVRFTANKGYSSQSIMYRIGKRMAAAADEGKDIYVMYLGDHDPSGLDMDRDVLERLELFSGVTLEVERLALLYSQVEALNPPENPAKMTDSRADGYVARFGYSSWELDAVEPRALAQLVTNAVLNLRDEDLWQEAVEREREMRAELMRFANEYAGRR